MSLNIPKSIKKEFKQGMSDLITFQGKEREIVVYLEPTKVSCPNCIVDLIQKASTNVYNVNFVRPINIFPGTSFQRIIYPAPFNVTSVSGVQFDPNLPNPKILMTALCPVCDGVGALVHENKVCIRGIVTLAKSGSPGFEDLSAGREGIQFARIKTYNTNYSVCRDAKYFIIGGIKYKIEIPARLKGLGDDSLTELYLSEVEEGPSVSTVYNQDIRLQTSTIGQTSDQATSGTPTTPPIVPGDDVW